MKRPLFILWLLTGTWSTLFAQQFTASVNKSRVAVGEAFQVSFTLNSNGSNFKAPSFSDFNVYSGPNQSSSMQFINGNMSQSLTLSYVLAAKKEGKATIASASIIADGRKTESNPLTIEVVKGTANQQNPGAAQSQNQSSPAQNTGDDLFARTIVSKSKVYQGEQITILHKVYTRYNLKAFQDVKFPDYTGFWSQEVPQQSQINLTQENLNGVVYYVAEMRKAFLFPQRSGTIEIEPMEVKCIVRQRSNHAPQSIFDQFFGTGGYEDVVMTAKSKPVKIEVIPLPEANKPADFSGAVGNFSFKAQVTKDKVKANDAINLNVSISGRGNIKLLDPVKINFPENFETYDPKITDNVSFTANGISGSKNFEYLIIPRKEGTYQLEPIHFSYFDPDKKSYVTLPSPEFHLTIEKAENKENGGPTQVITSVAKEEVKQLTNDIHYIKTNKVNFVQKGTTFFGSGIFYTGLISPLIAFISFLMLRQKYISYNSDEALVKSRKANKIAKKRLLKAEQFMQSNKKEDFYDELFRALYGYLGDKLDIPVADLSKEKISDSLKARKVNDAINQKLITTLDSCEFARYGPSSVSNNLDKIYSDAAELITTMEDAI